MANPIPPTIVQRQGEAPMLPMDTKSIADLSNDTSIRAMIYGPPKAGKTVIAATFPSPFFLDWDGEGLKCLHSSYFRNKYPKKADPKTSDIRFIDLLDDTDEYGLFKEPKDIRQAAFWRGLEAINQITNHPDVKTLVLDSATSMSKAARNVGLVTSRKRSRSQTWQHAKEDHMALLAMQDFGAEMSALEQLFDGLMNVRGKNIIVIAHDRRESTKDGLLTGVYPLLTGDRIRSQVARWFDDVWYLDANAQGRRILRCQPSGVLKSVGSRLGLPAEIPDPDYDSIMSALRKG